MPVCDCHTHLFRRDAIISATSSTILDANAYYSVGIHPWNSAECHNPELMEHLFSLPNVVGVGESGMDMLRGADEKTQIQLMERHIEWSESYGLPLILHCVKSANQIVALKKTHRPNQPWIIHGFRLNAHVAEMLMKHDIYMSFGRFFNPEALRLIPDSRLLIETDDSQMTINDIAELIGEGRNTSADNILTLSANTIHTLFTKISQRC
ncbi:MAG: TatD family hydrolase [Paramuribaculum sp.]|nr:TatD family hydrolase [Paramuribaculum sp.]